MEQLKQRLKKVSSYHPQDDAVHRNQVADVLNAERIPFSMDSFASHKRITVSRVIKIVSDYAHSRMPPPPPHYEYKPSLDEHPDMYSHSSYPTTTSRSPYPMSHGHYDEESTDSEYHRRNSYFPKDKPATRSKQQDHEYAYFQSGSRERERKNQDTLSHKSGKIGPFSEGAHSRHGDDSDEDEYPDRGYYPPLPLNQGHSNSRRQCKNCRKLHQKIKDVEGIARENEAKLRRYAYKDQENKGKLQELKRENDKLRARKSAESEAPDHMVPDFQYEQMRKNYEEKITALERALQKHDTEKRYLHSELYQQNMKIREQETRMYEKDMEIEKLQVEHLKSVEVRTTAPPSRPSMRYSDREKRANPSNTRQSRQAPGGDTALRSNRVGGGGSIPMTRTLSDQRPREDSEDGLQDQLERGGDQNRRRARSQRSLASEESDIPPVPASSSGSSSKRTFRVLNEDVSKSIFSDSLPETTRLGLMRSLAGCHSQEDVIRTLVSYGYVPLTNERYLELEMRYRYLEETHTHLQVQNDALKKTFDELKHYAEQLYTQSNQRMSNETALKLALKYCHRVVDMQDVILELKTSPTDKPHHTLPPLPHGLPYEPSVPPVIYLAPKVRRHLSDLDNDREFQSFISNPQSEEFISSLSSSWSHELSQNTTSGVSSVTCSSSDGDLTSDELDRFKRYTKQVFAYQGRVQGSLMSVEGLKGLETVREEVVPESDCQPSVGMQCADLEDAAQLEELYAIREEKAELRSRIYMMEQGKKQADLEISRKEIELREQVRVAENVEQQLNELRLLHRKPHSENMEYSQLKDALRRGDNLQSQYDDLYCFLKEHIKKSKENHEKCMDFISELHRANHALVDAYEKSMKQQRLERKQMREELQTHMSRAAEVQPGETHL